jgi:hypothetical protein
LRHLSSCEGSLEENMTKTVLFGAGLILFQLPLLGMVLTQERTWGGPDVDEGSGVATAPDDSVYVTGTTLSFGAGDRDAFLLKYDATGALVWQRTYGTPPTIPFLRADEFAQGVAAAPDGSAVYIAGQFGNGSVFLVKFDPDGGLVWQRTWGDNGNFTNGVAVAADGSVYLTGGSSTYDVGQGDVFVAKFNADGVLQWDLTWGGFGFDAGRDIAVDATGNVFIAGETSSFVGNDAFLLKVSSTGAVLWQRDWGTLDGDGFPGLTAAYGVGTGPDGSIYITGNAFDTGASANVILVKFDTNGNVVWQGIGGPGFGSGADVAVAADGQLFVTGNVSIETREGFGGHAFVAEYQPDGKKKKAIAWGGAVNESASGASIAISADGSIAVAGYAQSPPYVLASIGNSLRTLDAFTEVVLGTISDPAAPVNDLPGGLVLTPLGSETYAGNTDSMLLRLRR